ncbi:MAG TPA: DUF4382 domain-containing protein [Balneolaceae bacterium]|nr:DUF4382 domain-containing protein [Balneolaceae bacterium]
MSTTKTRKTVYSVLQSLFIFGLMVVTTVSCGDVNFSGPKTNKSHMNVHLTDAPANYQEVNIDVQGVRIHYTPTSNDTTTVDTTEGKWIDLPANPMKVNLLDLTNGVDTLLSSADLNPGRYSELRLILGNDNTVMVDSMMHNLKVPSGQHSGYKIKFNTVLNEGETIDVSIDFNAAKSVHEAGRSGKYILRPVLKAFVQSGEQVETGSISGMVSPSDSTGANIFAVMNEDTSSTETDTTGAFKLQGLDPGQYDVTVKPTNDQYSDTTLTAVSVEKGKNTNVGTLTLSESQ